MATIFEKIWNREIPSTPLYQNEERGVMAVLDKNPAVKGQVVVFPREAARSLLDLNLEREVQLLTVVRAVSRRMLRNLNPDLTVRHVEGYGVPDHAHYVVMPSMRRGESDKLHHPDQKLQFEGSELDDYLQHYHNLLWLPEEMVNAEGINNPWAHRTVGSTTRT